MFNHKSIALLIVLAMNNLAHADLTTGLVAHYPFNGNANDESGNGNNGTVYGATLTADRNGNANSAYFFNNDSSINASEYINILDNPSLRFNASFSISVWFNQFSVNNNCNHIIAKQFGSNNDDSYVLWTSNGNCVGYNVLNFGGSNSDIISIPIPELNIWHHIAIIADYQQQLVYLYLDSVYQQSASYASTSYDTNPVLIGADDNNGDDIPDYGWNGVIDDIRIYNRALSESEIQQLYSGVPTQQLNITKQGTGSGTVTSKPAGIDCSGGADQVCITVYPPPAGCQCSAAFPTGTAVTLTATPDTIYCITTPCPVNTWVGWGKDCAGTSNTCTVNMTADKTATATFNLGTPEFTIPVMTISPATPVTNGTFTATVTVKNQGTVAANGGQLRLWANQPTAPVCAATGGNKNVAVGTLAAGASKTFTITGLGAGAGGFKTLRAFVDATCVSTESNETNNQRTLSYRVAGRLPDLIVTNIAITPATPAKNTVFNTAITIKNQGLSHTTMGYLDVWTNQATTQTCGAIGNAWAEIGTLAAGASKVIILPVASGIAGSKTLRAFVDSWCEILESNETNNHMIKTYSVQ